MPTTSTSPLRRPNLVSPTGFFPDTTPWERTMHGCVALVAFAVTFTRYTWDVPSALCSDVKVQSGRGGAVRSPLPLFSSWLAPCVMVRCTRSGAQFSAWELDLLEPLSDPLAPVQVFRARVSLEPRLLEAIASAEARATAMDALEHAHDGSEGDDSEWEDEDVVSSRPPTPLARPPTPLPPPLYSRSPSPLSDPPPSPSCSGDSPQPPGSGRKRNRARGKKARRQRKRVATAHAAGFGPAPQARHSQQHREQQPHQSASAAADLPSSGAGGWTGPRASKKARLSREHIRRLRELLAEDWELVEWNGRDPKLILDADGRIVAVLLGRPEAADWDQVIAEMERVFEGVRLRGVARGVFKPKARRHRRGDFYVLKGGVTRGPGQKVCVGAELGVVASHHLFAQRPGNLAHSKSYRELLHLILSNRLLRRIGGFQSSCKKVTISTAPEYHGS
ncbi:hypothetical protein K438DRAFT_1762598 [Mycena galopus ATCC 62051]|nr:hypothetical protein K438DRAFT_1762598 [Mycena galopus ATCC 62051]